MLDAYAGGRFSSIYNQINLDLTGAITFSDPPLAQFDRSKRVGVANSGVLYWAVPIIGLRVRHQFTPSQHVFVKGDIGGFGLSGSSLFSWQAAAVNSYSRQFNGYALARRHRLPGAVNKRQLSRRQPLYQQSRSSFTGRWSA